MKRLGLWITFYAATMMAASWFSFHIGFQEGYDFATGLTTRTAAVKVICHGAAACEDAGNDGACIVSTNPALTTCPKPYFN